MSHVDLAFAVSEISLNGHEYLSTQDQRPVYLSLHLLHDVSQCCSVVQVKTVIRCQGELHIRTTNVRTA